MKRQPPTVPLEMHLYHLAHHNDMTVDQYLHTYYSNLTPRQHDCLTRKAAGYSIREIGRTLGISHVTVGQHLNYAAKKILSNH